MRNSPEELNFNGRVAIVTGAGRGLGRAYALELASRGAKIIVNDVGGDIGGSGQDASPASEVVNEIMGRGGAAEINTASVATTEGCQSIIQHALESFEKIDILIHNAGNVRHSPLAKMSDEDFQAVLDVHFMAGFRLVRGVFPLMAEAKYGRIVLTSSIGGLYGNHDIVNYAMSKSGMIGLNNVVALEGEAVGVKCNLIVPGSLTRIASGADERGFPIDFSAFPPMSPDMVAPMVSWLAHEECSVTGEMMISIAGRMARAFIAESPGIYKEHWKLEEIGECIDLICRTESPWVLPVVPRGHSEHIQRSFEMISKND